MNVDDDVREIIRVQVSGSRSRMPDPDEVLRVRCTNCDRPLLRPRRVVEKMNLIDGFVSCSNPCRRKQEQVPSQRVMRFPNL